MMDINTLKTALDLNTNLKTLVADESLLVSFRSLYVARKFGCENSCYVEVPFKYGAVVDVITMPIGGNCDLWHHVDQEINIKSVQSLL